MPIPLAYRVVLEVHRKEEKSKGGIILTNDHVEQHTIGSDIGTVYRIGKNACQDESLGGKPEFEVGDEVYFVRYGGYYINTPKGRMFRVVNDSEVICKVEPEDKENE